MMSNALLDLFRSVSDLYARFGLTPTPDTTARMFAEEARELQDAVSKLSLIRDWQSTFGEPLVDEGDFAGDMLGEFGDVLFTAVGVMLAFGLTPAALAETVQFVIAKNDAKTLDTHAVVNGKITRKPAE